jgi:hypothetical protein
MDGEKIVVISINQKSLSVLLLRGFFVQYKSVFSLIISEKLLFLWKVLTTQRNHARGIIVDILFD